MVGKINKINDIDININNNNNFKDLGSTSNLGINNINNNNNGSSLLTGGAGGGSSLLTQATTDDIVHSFQALLSERVFKNNKIDKLLSFKNRLFILFDIAKAMQFLHSQNILHRDLKV